jgi:urease accessory protein UreH
VVSQRRRWAGQQLDFNVAAGAALEWLPQESIVFDGARADMQSRVKLATGCALHRLGSAVPGPARIRRTL